MRHHVTLSRTLAIASLLASVGCSADSLYEPGPAGDEQPGGSAGPGGDDRTQGGADAGQSGSDAGGQVDPSSTVTLSLETSALSSFQAGVARRADGAPLPNAVALDATLGGTPLKVAVTDDRIAFTVPYGITGPVELQVDLGNGQRGTASLQISAAAPIPNAVAVMTTYFDEEAASLAALAELVADQIAAGSGSTEAATHLAQQQQWLADNRAAFMNATAEQQQVAAQMVTTSLAAVQDELAAGDQLFDEVATKSDADLQLSKPLLLKFSKHVFIFVAPAVIGGFVGGALLTSATAGIGSVGGATAGAVYGVAIARLVLGNKYWGQKDKAVAVWGELAALQLRPIDLAMEELKADIQFDDVHTTKPVTIDVGWRNMQESDADAPASWLSDVVRAIPKVNAAFDLLFPGELHLTFRQPNRGVEDPASLAQLKIVEVSEAGATCTLGGTTAAPTLSCSLHGQGLYTFTLRIELRVDQFVVLTAPIVVEFDARCHTTTHPSYAERSCSDPVTGRPTSFERCREIGSTFSEEWARTEYEADGTTVHAYVTGGNNGYHQYIEKGAAGANDSYSSGRCAFGPVDSGVSKEAISMHTEQRSATTCVVRDRSRTVPYQGPSYYSDTGPATVSRAGGSCASPPPVDQVQGAGGPSCAEVRAISTQNINSLVIMQEGLCGDVSAWQMQN